MRVNFIFFHTVFKILMSKYSFLQQTIIQVEIQWHKIKWIFPDLLKIKHSKYVSCQKFLPISGTLVTDGNADLLLDDDLSNDEADLLQRSSGIAGLDLLVPLPPRLFRTCPPELGPQVLPLTPSAGTIKNTWNYEILFERDVIMNCDQQVRKDRKAIYTMK